MRIDFSAFSPAAAFEASPNPSAPPAAAESLMKFLLVVDVMENGSMMALLPECK
jgi:hypothetical protein